MVRTTLTLLRRFAHHFVRKNGHPTARFAHRDTHSPVSNVAMTK